MSQSPLHRGFDSDVNPVGDNVTIGYLVTIPSSSGLRFGLVGNECGFAARGRVTIPSSSGLRFGRVKALEEEVRIFEVTIPSSSGLRFGLARTVAPGIKACSTVSFPVEPITETIDAWCPGLCYEFRFCNIG